MNRHQEDDEQAIVFHWASFFPQYLRWMHSIPNGGKRDKREGARLKKQGVKSGVYDIFLPLPMGKHHGLYIEMKRRKVDGSSSISANQKLFGHEMSVIGYKCIVCYGADEAIKSIKEYAKI